MAPEQMNEGRIWDEINAAAARMNPEQERMWECIRIMPERWAEPKYGSEGPGSWVVALMGQTVIWYDHIEEGFTFSDFVSYGTINKYASGDLSLEGAIQWLINRL